MPLLPPDLWQDGVIDCKDYAVRNSIQIEAMGYEPRWVLVKKGSDKINHVVVVFTDGDSIFIFDGDRLFRTSHLQRH